MKNGFTLIEAIIAILIFSLGVGAILNLALNLYRTHTFAFQQSLAISEAKKGIETMVKEIREAREGDDGSYIIERADDYEFIFFSDIDDDGATERVRYFLDGTDFKKGVIKPEGWPTKYPSENERITIITSHVVNLPPIFHYYDGEGNELPAPARLKDTKLMKVYLVVNIDPQRAPQDFTLESYVQLRNLKTNL
jgi:prepilin-type N-terminal cleavage/methylation domain-containing protein